MKRLTLSLALLLLTRFAVFAVDGMWLPLLLAALNEAEMKEMGMQMSAEDIYSVNRGSLKDAIVQFGGGCTGEIISPNGLLLTNHHCGFGQIQSHTTLQNNYLEDGFWAMTRKEELANPGLTATFISRIEDVTKQALAGVTEDMDKRTRQSAIDKNLDAIKNAASMEAWEEVMIRPFYHGNQYFLFITVTYRDVRLVGAPPSSIGKFGADTDNWVWPRHTGDFSIFRIYADKDNRPADYSEENVPFRPKHYLPISLDGVEEGDFTLVFGFPGRTNEYLPAVAVEQILDVIDPALISVRDKTLAIWDAAMRADAEVKIQYASKQASLANGWKKWQGEVLGLRAAGAVEKKRDYEKRFMKLVDTNRTFVKYAEILSEFEELYTAIEPYALAKTYYDEITSRNVELLRIAGFADRLVSAHENQGEPGYEEFKGRLASYLDGFYKNYRPEIDQDVFAALMEMMAEKVDAANRPAAFNDMVQAFGRDYEKMAASIFSQSFFDNSEQTMSILEKPSGDVLKAITNDPAYQLAKAFLDTYRSQISGPYNELDEQIDNLQQRYMKALMEVMPGQRFYPDANGTMRVSYGKVQGYQPRDAVSYERQTYLEGVMEKYVPGDYEFDVSPKLRQLYARKDYGRYQEKGKMPVCFIGSNHTTGGNSGSPAIDANGNLIGLNFDRVWEGTMSDYHFDEKYCRNIMVDVRYILFIIDKYAGAGHLIDEMTLVHPKRPGAEKKPAHGKREMTPLKKKPEAADQ